MQKSATDVADYIEELLDNMTAGDSDKQRQRVFRACEIMLTERLRVIEHDILLAARAKRLAEKRNSK